MSLSHSENSSAQGRIFGIRRCPPGGSACDLWPPVFFKGHFICSPQTGATFVNERATSVTLKPKAVALLFLMRDTNENVLFVGKPRVKCSVSKICIHRHWPGIRGV